MKMKMMRQLVSLVLLASLGGPLVAGMTNEQWINEAVGGKGAADPSTPASGVGDFVPGSRVLITERKGGDIIRGYVVKQWSSTNSEAPTITRMLGRGTVTYSGLIAEIKTKNKQYLLVGGDSAPWKASGFTVVAFSQVELFAMPPEEQADFLDAGITLSDAWSKADDASGVGAFIPGSRVLITERGDIIRGYVVKQWSSTDPEAPTITKMFGTKTSTYSGLIAEIETKSQKYLLVGGDRAPWKASGFTVVAFSQVKRFNTLAFESPSLSSSSSSSTPPPAPDGLGFWVCKVDDATVAGVPNAKQLTLKPRKDLTKNWDTEGKGLCNIM